MSKYEKSRSKSKLSIRNGFMYYESAFGYLFWYLSMSKTDEGIASVVLWLLIS